ncbi:hypothetical protein [Streptomyces sp. MMS24-I29]|uniref:hypothetical protein n=1 Tax=Streptomyces sp. MMS24-I29 TaxID=3351480 RepID=UPI003C7B1888
MGCDIHGFIECRRGYRDYENDSCWHAAINLDHLYDARDYDAFGCLFGVRNDFGITNDRAFEPLAAARGLPPDVSKRVRDLYEDHEGHSPTSISWAEVEKADWDVLSLQPDPYVHEYRRSADGSWQLYSRHLGAPQAFLDLSGCPPDVADRAGLHFPEGTEWLDGDRLFRTGRLRRKDVVRPDGQWKPVWTVMRTLAGLHGNEAIRLVVWFDS